MPHRTARVDLPPNPHATGIENDVFALKTEGRSVERRRRKPRAQRRGVAETFDDGMSRRGPSYGATWTVESSHRQPKARHWSIGPRDCAHTSPVSGLHTSAAGVQR